MQSSCGGHQYAKGDLVEGHDIVFIPSSFQPVLTTLVLGD